MKEFLNALPGNLSWVFAFLTIIWYYLSIKKCFWKKEKGKSKVKLFIITLFTNPVSLLLITLSIVFASMTMAEVKERWGMDESSFITMSTLISTILYLLCIFLFSYLTGKWLKTENKELVVFVAIMYSIVTSLTSGIGVTDIENPPEYGYIIDLPVLVIIYIAGFFIYRFVINALSKLTDRRRKINARLFIILPTLFTLFFNVFNIIAYYYMGPTEKIVVTGFSLVILFLFIWAFHVIIVNINATNEALDAQGVIAEMAKEEARLEADLSAAKTIQLSALPNEVPERKEFELFASMTPAKEVGGDFYDFYMLDDNTLGFLIADVSGKSIPGAMFMMTAKSVIKSLAESGLSPSEVFTKANEKLCENNEAEMFVTAWLGYLDLRTGQIRVANAGHNPPIMIHDGKTSYINLKPGLMLAGMEDIRYKEQTVSMQKGDTLFLFTDGVTEALDIHEDLYGEERLETLLSAEIQDTEHSGAEAVCRLVSEDLASFTAGAEQSDDVTMLCIKYLGDD